MNSSYPKRLVLISVMIVFCILMIFVGRKSLRIWQSDTLFEREKIVENFRSMPLMFDALTIKRSGEPLPLGVSPKNLPAYFEFQGKKIGINDWVRESGTTGLLVVANDQIAFEEYYQGNTAQTQAIGWSVTKSFMSLLIGIALKEGAIHSLQDLVSQYAPVLKNSAYKGVSLEDVLEMSSGVVFDEDYSNPKSGINQLSIIIALGGSVNNWVSGLKLAEAPGRKHNYISVDTQVLGMVLKGATGKGPAEYMQEKVWSRLGAECDGKWLTDAYATELAFGGLNLCLRDFSRLGLLYLHNGRNQAGETIVDERWVRRSITSQKEHLLPGRFQEEGQPSLGYGYQWWIPQGNEGEFMAIGVYGQFVYVNPRRRVVIAKNSAYADYNQNGVLMEYKTLEAFRAIARKITSGR
ncbi:6-aminohexanoate hydrolase [Pseudomonas protegens]|uniref:serine hydrolase domain-containing protein n=1 Tax=Pseudomonas protegens TaxID=380021 RepID=UPI000FF6089D|nr:serine hydrolase [Pseudomonas protegens]ROL72996.1 6-aminohexanoate hydrolase [Pseudomonas protegens]